MDFDKAGHINNSKPTNKIKVRVYHGEESYTFFKSNKKTSFTKSHFLRFMTVINHELRLLS